MTSHNALLTVTHKLLHDNMISHKHLKGENDEVMTFRIQRLPVRYGDVVQKALSWAPFNSINSERQGGACYHTSIHDYNLLVASLQQHSSRCRPAEDLWSLQLFSSLCTNSFSLKMIHCNHKCQRRQNFHFGPKRHLINVIKSLQ